MARIKTSSWYDKLPDNHKRIGISRGTPRGQPAGYRIYSKLAPGAWFNSVGAEEYYNRYRGEILAKLDPRQVMADLLEMAGGGVAVMLCFERAGKGQWCHRAMAAEWLANAIGTPVPEYGFEEVPQDRHPLMPIEILRLRGTAPIAAAGDAPAAEPASPTQSQQYLDYMRARAAERR